jgi:hypothetical protein
MEPRVLSKEEQLDVLVKIHNFLANYDRVPGAFASQFAQVLEGLVLVANSVQAELRPAPSEGAAAVVSQ